MTATHPDTIWAAQYGGTIAAENNPGSLDGDGMEYISRTAHDAAVSAARKEGMLAARDIALADEANDWTDGVPRGGIIAEAIDDAIAAEIAL